MYVMYNHLIFLVYLSSCSFDSASYNPLFHQLCYDLYLGYTKAYIMSACFPLIFLSLKVIPITFSNIHLTSYMHKLL